MTPCILTDCTAPAKDWELCESHYNHYRYRGDLLANHIATLYPPRTHGQVWRRGQPPCAGTMRSHREAGTEHVFYVCDTCGEWGYPARALRREAVSV